MDHDFISRKETIKRIVSECEIYELDGRSLYDARQVDRILNTVPTAFDKEKVIDEIRKASQWASSGIVDDDGFIDNYYDSEIIDTNTAIDIIENGGIEK